MMMRRGKQHSFVGAIDEEEEKNRHMVEEAGGSVLCPKLSELRETRLRKAGLERKMLAY